MSEEYLHEQIKKLSGILEVIFAWAVPNEMHYPHQHCAVNITKETLMGQSAPFKSRKGKVEDSTVAKDIVDRCGEISSKSQT